MHPEAERLFAADEALRKEADEMLMRSGLGGILERAGDQAVGSYPMHTMTWRDLDFHRYEEPDWRRHWEVGTQLAETGWCWRLNCVDAYREARIEAKPDCGLYWGLRVLDPGRMASAGRGSPTVWKLDLWTARADEFAAAEPKRQTWASLMSDELRSYVLAIKEAVCTAPEYRKSLLSVHIYEAVLEQGVRGVEEFRQWWRERTGVPTEGVP